MYKKLLQCNKLEANLILWLLIHVGYGQSKGLESLVDKLVIFFDKDRRTLVDALNVLLSLGLIKVNKSKQVTLQSYGLLM